MGSFFTIKRRKQRKQQAAKLERWKNMRNNNRGKAYADWLARVWLPQVSDFKEKLRKENNGNNV